MINPPIIPLYNKILSNYIPTKKDLLPLINADLEDLCNKANSLRKHFMGNSFDICTIINGKSGKCSEDCKFCAQSAHYNTQCQSYPLLSKSEIEAFAQYNNEKGIMHFSIVTSGKKLTQQEIDNLAKAYSEISTKYKIKPCGSHGLLSYSDLLKLKNSGLTRYHNNLETSPNYFKNICTTHSQQDKINTIISAQKAGLEICSGGIIGLGETMEDRIDMALSLQNLNVVSVPINVLNPIKNTPFENNEPLTLDEIRRTIAIFRFALPNKYIKLAGGRGLLADKGKCLFMGGANGAISGDMLTTSGITISEDMTMLKALDFKL